MEAPPLPLKWPFPAGVAQRLGTLETLRYRARAVGFSRHDYISTTRTGPRAAAPRKPLIRPRPSATFSPGRRGKKFFLRAGALKTSFSLSEGRGWLAPRAFTSGRETGEGLLPVLVTRRRDRIDNRAHKLVRKPWMFTYAIPVLAPTEYQGGSQF